MIDSHCHLTDERFTDDLDAVLQRAAAAWTAWMVTIADSVAESKKCIATAQKYEQIFCSVGVHPHKAKEWTTTSAQSLRDHATSSQKVVAVGEIGLDYHHVKPLQGHVASYDFSPRDVQRRVFQEQLELAKELHIPVVVHCREAVEDVWSMVDVARPEKLVMHCCTERWEDVRRFVDRGYVLSFTGIATYPKSEEVRRTIHACPLERMMVETDAPYL
ncbi:TatD family hydrolase, partial [Candidatus Peregrinibacteria bacterium]|nr:TatD family hydrolase [Candidatus Peregrinibacteria bacterium]